MMHSNTISVRAAQPTREEGRIFARCLNQAAEDFFRFMLGGRWSEILAAAYLEPGHDLSFQNVHFAERDGRLLGMVSGYTAEEHRRSSQQPLREAAGRWNLRFKAIGVLLAPLFRVIDSVADGDFYLQAIAVDPEARSGGIGTLLMDWVEARAVTAGSARLALDVSAKNEGARRLYERRGMRVESRWPRRIKIPGLKLCRMTKELSSGG